MTVAVHEEVGGRAWSCGVVFTVCDLLAVWFIECLPAFPVACAVGVQE